MQGLAVKDVEFNGAVLRAAQVEDIVWVGVRWVCQGLGFSENKIKYERKRLQNDAVLKDAVKILPIGTSNGNKDTICINIEYIPIWLTKISITPRMIREQKEIVDNLIVYQNNVKDILYNSFSNNQLKVNLNIEYDDSNDQKGYIYVMKMFNYYKIGKAKDKESSRFGEYTNLPEKPDYIEIRLVDNYSSVEHILHRRFQRKRIRGEWFKLNKKDLSFISDFLDRREIMIEELMAE